MPSVAITNRLGGVEMVGRNARSEADLMQLIEHGIFAGWSFTVSPGKNITATTDRKPMAGFERVSSVMDTIHCCSNRV